MGSKIQREKRMRRDRLIQFWLNEREAQLFREYCDAQFQSQSETLRDFVKEKIKEQKH